MLKNLMIIIAIPALIFLGGKAAFHYRISTALDAGLEQAAPFVTASYETVTSDIDGTVGIRGISISPVGQDDVYEIEELSIKFPDILYLWDIEEQAQKLILPERLEFNMLGLSLDPDGDLIEEWEQSFIESEGYAVVAGNCVARSLNLVSTMSDLGFRKAVFDATGGFKFVDTEFSVFGHYSARDAESADIEITFPETTNNYASVAMALADPTLLRASVTLKDEGMRERLYEYCARLENLEPEQVNELLEAELIARAMRFGIMPDEPLLKSYREYLASDSGKTFTITSEPWNPQKFSNMSLFEPEDMPDLLNLSAHVN